MSSTWRALFSDTRHTGEGVENHHRLLGCVETKHSMEILAIMANIMKFMDHFEELTFQVLSNINKNKMTYQHIMKKKQNMTNLPEYSK